MNNQPLAEVTIHEPTRKELFLEIFGTNKVPVTSMMPGYTNLPGFSEPQLAYLLDMNFVTEEQRSKIIDHIAKRFELPREFVRTHLQKDGVPILASHTSWQTSNQIVVRSIIFDDVDMNDDDDDMDEDWETEDWEDCGMTPDFDCLKAGSEYCDWVCPHRGGLEF